MREYDRRTFLLYLGRSAAVVGMTIASGLALTQCGNHSSTPTNSRQKLANYDNGLAEKVWEWSEQAWSDRHNSGRLFKDEVRGVLNISSGDTGYYVLITADRVTCSDVTLNFKTLNLKYVPNNDKVTSQKIDRYIGELALTYNAPIDGHDILADSESLPIRTLDAAFSIGRLVEEHAKKNNLPSLYIFRAMGPGVNSSYFLYSPVCDIGSPFVTDCASMSTIAPKQQEEIREKIYVPLLALTLTALEKELIRVEALRKNPDHLASQKELGELLNVHEQAVEKERAAERMQKETDESKKANLEQENKDQTPQRILGFPIPVQ